MTSCIADGWRAFFAGLPDGARILDLCTGNGAAALIAAEGGALARSSPSTRPRSIRPPSSPATPRKSPRSRFVPETDVEALPFPDGGFGAVISQYGIEYSDLDKSLPEAVRMLAPGGRLRFVVHAADGVVAADARTVIADADLLLDEIDLPGHAARCFEAVLAVERGGGDNATRPTAASPPSRPRSSAPPATSRRRTTRPCSAIPARCCSTASSAAAAFDLEQLLAKVEEVRGEIAAHRGRLRRWSMRRSTGDGAEALAVRVNGEAAPLVNDAGLIGHVVEARARA